MGRQKILLENNQWIDYCFCCCSRKLCFPRRILKIGSIFLILSGFVYLNYMFNLPVFHFFRNRNIDSPCLLPVFDIYDESIDQFFRKQQDLPCENWLDLFYVNSSGFLWKNDSAIAISGFSALDCEYRYIVRKSEKKFVFLAKEIYRGPVYLNGDFVHVECYNSKHTRVYNNLHLNIDYKFTLRSRQLSDETKTDLSVYIVGIDSLSRLIAERKLPKTLNFLREDLGAYMFNGYTRVGDSSFPNLAPMFTGLHWENLSIPVNDLPYIYKNFSKRGAVNFYAEDWHETVAFKGFKEQPTRHYIQPLSQAMDEVRPSFLPLDITLKFLQNHNIPLSKVSSLCFGNIKRFKVVMEYYKRFMDAYHSKRKFGFSWINELAHDFFNMVELADHDYMEFFKWMKETNKLENAVLIFMGDHGPRYSEIQNTDIGRLSNLLPMMSIVLPNHIRTRYPHIHRNMKKNTERLTTPFDIYAMLRDILNSNFNKNNEFQGHKLRYGVSLFEEIPSNRSCRDGGIPEHYCPCYTSKQVSTKDTRIWSAARIVVEKINQILTDVQSKCAKMQLASIHRASLVYADLQRDKSVERTISLRSYLWTIKESTRFLITFRTRHGNALFEATVEYLDGNSIKVLGDISRINKYGNQSDCIDKVDTLRRRFCYCI